MYNAYNNYPCSNYKNMPWYNENRMYDMRRMYPYSYFYPMYTPEYRTRYPNQLPYDYMEYPMKPEYPEYPYPNNNAVIELMDYGPEPFALNINEATMQNDNFRTALWTGNHMQLTLMSLNPGEDIGTEMHPNVDQFIRIEDGEGLVRMGDNENLSDFEAEVYDDFIFIIPAGKYHNLYNTGSTPLKLYSIYAPPNHPRGTVHVSKEDEEH